MRIGDMSKQMKDMRKQMEEDAQLGSLMAGLRGQNIDDSDFADANVVMRLVEVDRDEQDALPQVGAVYSCVRHVAYCLSIQFLAEGHLHPACAAIFLLHSAPLPCQQYCGSSKLRCKVMTIRGA